MAVHEKCIMVGGYATPPRDMSVQYVYRVLACQLLIDKSTHCIVQSHFNMPSPLTSDFIQDLILGHCMDDDFEPLAAKIKAHLHLQIVNSVIHCLRNALERYREIDMSIWR